MDPPAVGVHAYSQQTAEARLTVLQGSYTGHTHTHTRLHTNTHIARSSSALELTSCWVSCALAPLQHASCRQDLGSVADGCHWLARLNKAAHQVQHRLFEPQVLRCSPAAACKTNIMGI